MLVACVREIGTTEKPRIRGGEIQNSWGEVQMIKKDGKKEMNVGEWWNGLSNKERERNWVRFEGKSLPEQDGQG